VQQIRVRHREAHRGQGGVKDAVPVNPERGLSCRFPSRGEKEGEMTMLYGHAFLMGAGLLLMAVGVSVAKFLRRRRWWLKVHRVTGSMIPVCLAAGLSAAVVMISQSGGGHFRVPHAWLGMAAVLAGISTPVLGVLQFRFRDKILLLRKWHRGTGYTALLLTLLSLLSGLAVAGVI